MIGFTEAKEGQKAKSSVDTPFTEQEEAQKRSQAVCDLASKEGRGGEKSTGGV